MNKDQYSGKFSDVYDTFLEEERVAKEVEYLTSFLSDGEKKILDVGCGTGNHSIAFARKNYDVVGYDPSKDMIRRAKSKSKQEGLDVNFFSGSLDEVLENNFDFCCSMFNVVNHITEKDDLLKFFRSVEKKLKPNGRFVFDTFNLERVKRDPPNDKKYKNGYTSSATYFNETDLMEIKYDDGVSKFDLLQRIWSLKFITEMLKLSNLKVEKIYKWYRKQNYENSDYKLTFVCTKGNK